MVVPVQSLGRDPGQLGAELVEFMLRFLARDNLGAIAHSHLAVADASPLKANDPKAKKVSTNAWFAPSP